MSPSVENENGLQSEELEMTSFSAEVPMMSNGRNIEHETSSPRYVYLCYS